VAARSSWFAIGSEQAWILPSGGTNKIISEGTAVAADAKAWREWPVDAARAIG
jgi:hypothetical protein